jgi:hypothetical protein
MAAAAVAGQRVMRGQLARVVVAAARWLDRGRRVDRDTW